jgi:hypothetical protein
MVGAQRIDAAVGQRRTQCLAVELGTQRRHGAALRIEVADVHVAQVQRVDGHIAAHLQTVQACLVDQHQSGTARDARQMHATAGGAGQLQHEADGQRLGEYRNAGQPQTRSHFTFMRHAFGRQVKIGRLQPYRVAEGGCVLHGAEQHLRIGHRHVGLAEGDAAGVEQFAHFGQALALETRPSAHRADRHVRD